VSVLGPISAMLLNCILQGPIWYQAAHLKGFLAYGASVIVPQPLCDGLVLEAMTIAINHRVAHHTQCDRADETRGMAHE